MNEKLRARQKEVRGDLDDPAFDEYKVMARTCLLWRMSPEYYKSMTQVEMAAWVEAWNEIQSERQKGA